MPEKKKNLSKQEIEKQIAQKEFERELLEIELKYAQEDSKENNIWFKI